MMFSLISLLWLSALPVAIASPLYEEDYEPGLNPCVDWEVGAASYQEAFAKWQEPPCYTFTYAFQGWGDGTPVVRSVRDGTALQVGDNQPFQTLADIWNNIDELCFRNCPTSGAHYCEIQYTTNTESGLVYPSTFKVDPEDKIGGEDYIYFISDVLVGECPDLEPVFERLICVDWETRASAYDEAFAQWVEPSCYTFTYTYQSSYASPTPVVRTVRNGASLQNGDAEQFQTLIDLWNEIDLRCLQDCPTSGAHNCEIQYATTDDGGFVYPSFISIDFDGTMTGDETIYLVEDTRAVDCAELEGIESDVLKTGKCVNYLADKKSLEMALLDWEQAGDCYNYTIERRAIFTNKNVSQEYLGPFQIVVRDGIPNIVGETAQTEMNRTLSDWLTEIQDRVVDRCRVEHDEDPYDEHVLRFDPVWGYPLFAYLNPAFSVVDDELSFFVSGFSRCAGQKAGVCIDNDQLKSNHTTSMESWYNVAVEECYAYSFEQKGNISEDLRGPFDVLVRDGIPEVFGDSTEKIESDGRNMTFSMWDWVKLIEEHCIIGCESDSSLEAYYNCTVEYDPYSGTPTYILFDVDGNVTGEEMEYTLSGFLPCSLSYNPETERNEFDAASAKLETLLTDKPCYDFTYTELSSLSQQAIKMEVRNEVTDNETLSATDGFFSLVDLMSFYRTSCFPIVPQEFFRCTISFNDLGVPIELLVNYMPMSGGYEASYQVDNVTFVSCDTNTTVPSVNLTSDPSSSPSSVPSAGSGDLLNATSSTVPSSVPSSLPFSGPSGSPSDAPSSTPSQGPTSGGTSLSTTSVTAYIGAIAVISSFV